MKKLLTFLLFLFIEIASAGTLGLNYTTYAAGGPTPNVSNLTALTTGTVSTVNFNWSGGYVLDSGRADGVAVHFTGYFKASTAGAYYFGTTTDDGSVLKVNSVTVVDAWREQGPTFWYGSTILSAGQIVPIDFWYYENGGGAVAQLYWINPLTGNWEIIPSSNLATSSDYWGATVTGTTTSDAVSTSSSSSSTDAITVTRPTETGNFSDVFVGTTTITNTTTTPVTTTSYSDGSTSLSYGQPSTTTTTTYTVTTQAGVAPTYTRDSRDPYANVVYIKQVYSWSSTQVDITQDGHGNMLTGTDSNWATVDGNGSLISVKQTGQNNIVGLKMNAWGNNIDIQQGLVGADANNNVINVESFGNGNSIVTRQDTNSNTASIKVNYDINNISLNQTGGTGNTSHIIINGNWNSVNNVQNGFSNFSLINISGDNNSASVTQNGVGHSALLNLINAGGANNVSVLQNGIGDSYSLQQTCTNPAGCSVSVIRNK